jgi:hypothetical protein
MLALNDRREYLSSITPTYTSDLTDEDEVMIEETKQEIKAIKSRLNVGKCH